MPELQHLGRRQADRQRSMTERWLSMRSAESRHVRGRRHIAASSGPIDVDVFALGILVTGIFGLDAERVSTKVVALGLQQICRKIFGAVTVVEAESCAEGGCRDSPKSAFADNVAPTRLSVVNGLVEEVVEK